MVIKETLDVHQVRSLFEGLLLQVQGKTLNCSVLGTT